MRVQTKKAVRVAVPKYHKERSKNAKVQGHSPLPPLADEVVEV